ncbi:hypothetical protein [Paraburkholderia sp. JHI869]|uniref:hypothetical protein n=1 Tax=Paraburkholderia sp. JHI869 TaxID=3112959 RepID=UPI00317D8F20
MKTAFNQHRTVLIPTLLAVCLAIAAPLPVNAAGRGGGAHAAREHAGGGPRGGGGGPHGGGAQVNSARADARTRNVRNTSVNNVNVNRNVNVNANVDRHGGWDDDYHPVATAAAVTAAVGVTSAVVGSIVHSVPSNCVPVNYGGMVYQQCGSTWYQPQGAQYVVVNAPY